MGESSLDRAPFEWNRSIEIDGSDESVSADAGALLIREILEHSRIVSWLEENLIDDRRPGSVVHSVGNLLRTCLVLLCQGHRDQDDADRYATTRRLLLLRSHREALSTEMDAMACRRSQRFRALWIC